MSNNNMKAMDCELLFVGLSHLHSSSWLSLKGLSIRFLVYVVHSTQRVSCLPPGIVNTKVSNGTVLTVQLLRLSWPLHLDNVYFKAKDSLPVLINDIEGLFG